MLSKIFLIGATLAATTSANNLRNNEELVTAVPCKSLNPVLCAKLKLTERVYDVAKDRRKEATQSASQAADAHKAASENDDGALVEVGSGRWNRERVKHIKKQEQGRKSKREQEVKHIKKQEQGRKSKREQEVKRISAKVVKLSNDEKAAAAKSNNDKKAATGKWFNDKKAFLATFWEIKGAMAKYFLMCGLLTPDKYCTAKTAGIYFPQANFPEATSYDGILKYSELMLAFVNAGYKFKRETGNTAPHSQAFLKSLHSLIGTDLVSHALKPSEMCKLSAGTTNMYGSDPFVEIMSWSHQSKHANGRLNWNGHDTQSSTYEIEFDDEYLMVYQLRGSEMPDFGKGAVGITKENAASIVQDWFGSDFEVTPADDEICKKAGVKVHSGFQKAYNSQRVAAIAYMKKRLLQIKAKTTKTVKLFVTGHSLGAAQASLAAYDFHCNKHFKDSVGDHVYLITQGQPIVYHGDVSLKAYQSTVPATHRIRQMAVSAVTFKGNTFTVGDMIGMSFPAAGYNQPGDDFLGTEVQPRDIEGDQKFGYDCHPQTSMLNGVACHLLDRYNEGLASRADTYEGICAATTPESQKKCDFCK